MSTRFNNQKGFSLIELMVVVAIIGILAAIAVPNVLKFMAKARQSEVKTILSGIYTAEKAFFAEYNSYYGGFQGIGFTPEGQLRYNTGFPATVIAVAGFTAPATIHYTTDTFCQAVGGCSVVKGAGGANVQAIPAVALITASAFKAAGSAIIYIPVGGGTGTADNWSLDQAKVFKNDQPGIL